MQPHSPGLRSRLWYGGASLRSAAWAGEHGMNFLTSSVVRAEESEDFAEIQRSHIRAFRSAHPTGRVSQGLVVIPTDGAVAVAAREVRGVRGRADAADRRAAGSGPAACSPATCSGRPRRSPRALHAHAGFQEVTEVAFALPFSFDEPDYVQILTDIATRLGPALGWKPAG